MLWLLSIDLYLLAVTLCAFGPAITGILATVGGGRVQPSVQNGVALLKLLCKTVENCMWV